MADDLDQGEDTPIRLPADRDLIKPIQEKNPPIENKKGKLVSKPDTAGLEQDDATQKLPSLDKMERELSENFFKSPSQTRDAIAGSLISGSFDKLRSKMGSFEKRWMTPKQSAYLATDPDVKAPPVAVQNATSASLQNSPVYVGAVVAGSQAQIEALRLTKAYHIPYMKRNLALAYLRTNMMKKQLSLTDQFRRDVLAKLDTLKTNIAVPDAAKGSLLQKIMEETRRQAIARVASSIQGIGFQYANKFYTKYVTNGAAGIARRLKSGEGLRDLISDGARAQTHAFLTKAAKLRSTFKTAQPDSLTDHTKSVVSNILRRVSLVGAAATRSLVRDTRGPDFGGQVIAPLAEFASQFNPFNKSIFTPISTTGVGDDLVLPVDPATGAPSKSNVHKTPLYYAFVEWAKEYRSDQAALRDILQGKKVDAKSLRRESDLDKTAGSRWDAIQPKDADTPSDDASKSNSFFSRFKRSAQFKDLKKTVSDKLDTSEDKTIPDPGGIEGYTQKLFRKGKKRLSETIKKDIPSEAPSDETSTDQKHAQRPLSSIKKKFAGNDLPKEGPVYGPVLDKDGNDIYRINPERAKLYMGPGGTRFKSFSNLWKQITHNTAQPDGEGVATDTPAAEKSYARIVALDPLRKGMRDAFDIATGRMDTSEHNPSARKEAPSAEQAPDKATDLSKSARRLKRKALYTKIKTQKAVTAPKNELLDSEIDGLHRPDEVAPKGGMSFRQLFSGTSSSEQPTGPKTGIKPPSAGKGPLIRRLIPKGPGFLAATARDAFHSFAPKTLVDAANEPASDTTPESVTPKFNRLRAIAGLGMIAAPFVVKKLSAKTADKLSTLGNREVGDDIASLRDKAASVLQSGVDAATQSGVAQDVLASQQAQDARKTLSRAERKTRLYAGKGLRFAANTKLGKDVYQKLQGVPFYQDLVGATQKKSFLEHALGRRRKASIEKDIGSLKHLNYKSLGKIGLGLATGGAALSAARYGYNFVRGRDTKENTDQLRTYFGIKGLTLPKLVEVINDPKYTGIVSDGERKRLELGEPLHRVLSSRQISMLSKTIRENGNAVADKINSTVSSGISGLGSVVSRHSSPLVGGLVEGAAKSGLGQAEKIVGSFADNLRSLSLAVGITPKDNIFTRYTEGLRGLNSAVKTGGGIFSNLFNSVFGKDKDTRMKSRGLLAGAAALKLGGGYLVKKFKTHERDRIIAEGIANRTPLQKASRTALLTMRNVFYNPDRYTRDEFKEHKTEEAAKATARKKASAETSARFKQERAAAKVRRAELYKKRDDEKARKKAELKAAHNPNLVSLLLQRLGPQKGPRSGAWQELMKQRDAEKKGAWYSWRRALGPKDQKGDDVHHYADNMGLFGGLLDKGAAFSNSLLGTLAGMALRGTGRAAWGLTKFGGRTALRGYDAAKMIGLRGAVKAGSGALSLVGKTARTGLGMLKGPLGIGLLAHEVNKGFAENTTGAVRRTGTTLASMAEYGSMGAFFGPWGIAIGAGVGALVANMDLVGKALRGVGRAVATVAKPFLWLGKEAAKAAWAITKGVGTVIGGIWTGVFGRGAKRDKYGRVISYEKNGLLGNFRAALFGQKAKYSKDGQLIAPARRSVFGVVRDGFTKTFFGDKFSNGSYKPGTSLIDMAWTGMKKGVVATGKFFMNLPSMLWKKLSDGFSSIWNGMKNIVKKGADFVKHTKDKVTNGVKNVAHSIHDLPKNIIAADKRLLKKGKNAVVKAGQFVKRKAVYAAQHPFLAVADAQIGTLRVISKIPGASPIAGAAAAASKWVLNSEEMWDSNSPVRRYIKACLDLYGVENTQFYEFIHQMEIDEEKVADGKLKQYNHDDLKWFAGKFGLDPNNADSVNYFITWFNNRFLPMFEIIRKIAVKHQLLMSNVILTNGDVLLGISKEIEAARKTIPASVASLKPSLMAFKKQSQDANRVAWSKNATKINEPDKPSAVNGKPTPPVTSSGNQSNNDGSAPTGKTSASTPTRSVDTGYAPTVAPDVTPGNVSDQKEYKAAYQLLSNEVKAIVDKDKALQFALWAESVQDGAQKTAHTFNTEYRAGETNKNFLSDIYQDRSQHFTENDPQARLTAVRQLYKEQQFAGSISDGAAPTMDQMSTAIGRPVMSFGNGTEAPHPIIPKPEQRKRALEIMKYIQDKYHYSKAFAAGMAAQEVVESRMDPRAVGDGGQAYGAFQWHPDRQKKIYDHFKKPLQQMSLEEETDAAIWELKSGADPQSKNLLSEVGQSNDPRAVVSAFVNEYERPADRTGNVITRTNVAAGLLKSLSDQTNAATGGSGNTGGASVPLGQNDAQQAASGGGGTQVAAGGASSGSPSFGGVGGASAGSATPTAITAHVDQSSVVGKLDEIHKTLKQSATSPTSTPVAATVSTPTQQPTDRSIVRNSPPITINQFPQPNGGGSQNYHQSAVDMALHQTTALVGSSI